MFEICMHFSVFYCLCFVNGISTHMLEQKVLGYRGTDLQEEEEGVRILDAKEEHCKYVAEENDEDRSNIYSLMW